MFLNKLKWTAGLALCLGVAGVGNDRPAAAACERRGG